MTWWKDLNRLTIGNDGKSSFLGGVSAYEAVVAESWDPVQHNVEFATVNATRWHSSVWKAYVFVYNNLSAIAEFYCQETECKSILDILDMAKNKGTVKIILKELEEYIACFNTTAQYLNRISDHSSEAPVACHVASLEEQVVHGFKLLRTNELHPIGL